MSSLISIPALRRNRSALNQVLKRKEGYELKLLDEGSTFQSGGFFNRVLLAGLINQRTREDMVAGFYTYPTDMTLQGFYGRNNSYYSTSHTAPNTAD